MSSGSITITDPLQIPKLDKAGLVELFKSAYKEACKVQVELDKIIQAQRNIESFQQERNRKGRPSVGLSIFLFWCYIIPGVIYQVVKHNIRKEYDRLIACAYYDIGEAEKAARAIAGKCVVLPIVPEDYRTPLALRTMIKYLVNGQADNWKECSHRYDEQSHWWTVEHNSSEALEIQKYTAMMTELAARRAGMAATAATVSAVGNTVRAASNILSWF
jgi:hypothetical protein